MWYSTCHDRQGAWTPSAGRCQVPALQHPTRPGYGNGALLVLGMYRGARLDPDAVCGGLVCAVCGACQGGLRQDAA